jgi:hypothetical protein
MSTQTRGTEVITKLLALVGALTGYIPEGTSGAGVKVVDAWDLDDDAYDTAVIIGVGDPDDEQPEPSVEIEQQLVSMGPGLPKAEEIKVRCRVISTGAQTKTLARAAAQAVIDDIGAMIRTDPTLGITSGAMTGGMMTHAHLAVGSMIQTRDVSLSNPRVEWDFTITAVTRV